MKCPNCQHDNPSGAKFCLNCGNRLALPCPNCSTELPADAKFCFNCGHNLQGAPSPGAATPVGVLPPEGAAPPTASLDKFIPPEMLAKLNQARQTGAMAGERRIVTMLFCDVKGSTAAASQLDPEDWADIINGAFESMIRPVYKYEGTIARLMGDAILAFFGAPLAHEDDPERAVRAALEILSGIQPYRQQVKLDWGLDMDVRVGINTGLVVVGAVGSDLHMEYSALGDAINLAARMEQTAAPGTIQIAEPTYKIVAPLFEFESLGGIEVKGKDEPVAAYRVLGIRATPGRQRGIAGLDSPLVGRAAEMQTLRQAIADLRQGRGGLVSVIAEAGLGKSRLIAELRTEAAPGSNWLEGRSFSYETATPYAPFIDLLTGSFGLQPGQGNAESYTAISRAIEALAPGRAASLAPFLAALLNIEPSGADRDRIRFLDPPQLRGGIFHAVEQWITLLAGSEPLILVFDDLHWIDPTSLGLLGALLPLVDRIPLLVIALFRPRRQEPSWEFHETAGRDFAHRYHPLELHPLDETSTRTLVANLLHVEGLPEKVRRLILEKAEGNPFFVEEVIRSMIDSGLIIRDGADWRATREIANLAVPDTLAAVITTRLDRLDEPARQIVQTASVIGREFQFGVLAQVYPAPLDLPLDDLQRRQLVREKTRLPERLYMFKHTLIQETAYASLLLKKRRELHLGVADCLEKNEPDRVAEIARHYLAARLPARALPYLVKTADKAAAAYATPEAIGFYTQALGLLQRDPNLPLMRAAYEGLGGILTMAQRIPEALENYQRMKAAAEQQGDAEMKISALNKLGLITALYMGQFAAAGVYIDESDVLARTHNDKLGISELSLVRCMMCTAVADFEGVVRYMDETVAISKELNQERLMAEGFHHIASSQMYMGLFEKGWETVQEGLALTRRVGDRQHEAGLLFSAALYQIGQGDLAAAYQTAGDAVQIASQIGAIALVLFCEWEQGLVAELCGDYQQALAHQLHAYETGAPLIDFIAYAVAGSLGALGSCYLNISMEYADQAAQYRTKAIDLLANPLGAIGAGAVYAEVGLSLLELGEVDAAADLLQRGLDSPSTLVYLETPRYLAGLALVALARGHLAEALEKSSEARAYALDRGIKYLYPFMEWVQGRVQHADAMPEAALDSHSRGAQLALDMGMRPLVLKNRLGAAAALEALNRPTEAAEQRAAALTAFDEIAALFTDPDMRAKFEAGRAALQ